MTHNVLALDVASTLGWAFGPADGIPESGFIKLGGENADVDGKLSGCINFINGMMRDRKPDRVVIEAPFLNAEKTSMTQLVLSYGMQGIIRGMARRYGCLRVSQENVTSIQNTFINLPPVEKGQKKPKFDTDQKKHLVRQRCIQLGWTTEEITNLDQTDACAVWAYGVSKFYKDQAARFTPLFAS